MDSARVPPGRIELYRETLRPVHQQAQGLLHRYWLVDRERDEVRIVGPWDSQESAVWMRDRNA